MERGRALFPTARSKDEELPLEDYVPKGLEPVALWRESPMPEDADGDSNCVNNTSKEEDYDRASLRRRRASPTTSVTAPRMTATWRAGTAMGRSIAHGTHPVDTDTCQEHSHYMPPGPTRAVPGRPLLSGPSATFSGTGESYSRTGEESLDSVGLHPHSHCAEGSQDYLDGHLPILEDKPSVLEAHDQE
ncbi:hypothetical protein P7K49_019342 [Saguinus oedipus]|uniref:Uncharacterized protein n=1 Tax=Saguinus oedipus TaxID=9490 RepID=A0ABQ9UXU5_SAGOE|nr:hypothetical protein P7K49_019342 [Saguinus oedipus]